MKIQRREQLSPQEFVQDYLVPGRPVIVTDAMGGWTARSRLHPTQMRKEFGRFDVLVYDHLFDLQDVRPLGWYLDRHFDKPNETCQPYVRAYSQLRGVEFVWADALFERLRNDWGRPYFLPVSGYAVPCHMDSDFDPARDRAPYRGLFVSGKGARTRLHRDPFTSSAMLCQFHGEKHFRMWSPDQAAFVMNGDEFVDPNAPQPLAFPHYSKAWVSFDDILSPGEIIFIPGGWFHDVACLSDSISITWNFVHRSRLAALLDSMRTDGTEKELEVVQFFLEPHAGHGGLDRIAAFLKNHAARAGHAPAGEVAMR